MSKNASAKRKRGWNDECTQYGFENFRDKYTQELKGQCSRYKFQGIASCLIMTYLSRSLKSEP